MTSRTSIGSDKRSLRAFRGWAGRKAPKSGPHEPPEHTGCAVPSAPDPVLPDPDGQAASPARGG